MLENDVKKVYISKEQIEQKCKELGQQITKDYQDSKELILIGILKGSLPFMAKLMNEIDLPLQIDLMVVSSYEGSESTGYLKIKKDVDVDLKDKDVLIVEDIIDTGFTLTELKKVLFNKKAKSVKIVSLLDKPSRRIYPIKADYIGFEIENEFVIGFGLDYNGIYRNLPYIGVLKEELYK